MSLPERFKDCGFAYWDFFLGKHGNPYTIQPTAKMISSYEIYTKSYREFIPSGNKKEKGYFKDPIDLEVYYDRKYVEAYREKMQDVYDVLLLLENRVSTTEIDLLAEFERSHGVVPSLKNPRHSLYLKLKEYRDNARNNS